MIEPFDLAGLLFRDACVGIQAESAGAHIHEEVKESLAFQVRHDFPAETVEHVLGSIRRQETGGSLGEQPEAGLTLVLGRFGRIEFKIARDLDVRDSFGRVSRRAFLNA